VIRHDHERRAVVDRVEHAAQEPVGVRVHLLDGPAVLALLLGELAGEAARPEEVPEEMRGESSPST
jgi:hypothetical protein